VAGLFYNSLSGIRHLHHCPCVFEVSSHHTRQKIVWEMGFVCRLKKFFKIVWNCCKVTGSAHCINPILHTTWLNNNALTLKRNTAKYLFW
jgi:hypothetical protein